MIYQCFQCKRLFDENNGAMFFVKEIQGPVPLVQNLMVFKCKECIGKKGKEVIERIQEGDDLEIDKDDFELFEEVRTTGIVNMFIIKNVATMSGLSREKVLKIMNNYEDYRERFKGDKNGHRKKSYL